METASVKVPANVSPLFAVFVVIVCGVRTRKRVPTGRTTVFGSAGGACVVATGVAVAKSGDLAAVEGALLQADNQSVAAPVAKIKILREVSLI
jgi:hypothetical protein